jgi:uncharacterized protein YdhG (YjbR/CyaY superfamily)
MNSQATSVPDYLAELPDDRRTALTKLRSVLRKAAPDAKEAMAHGMPSYELNGMLYALASQKNHMALYVCEPEIVDAHREALGKLNSGKGCIRFRRLEELPVDAIAAIVREAHAKRRKAG